MCAHDHHIIKGCSLVAAINLQVSLKVNYKFLIVDCLEAQWTTSNAATTMHTTPITCLKRTTVATDKTLAHVGTWVSPQIRNLLVVSHLQVGKLKGHVTSHISMTVNQQALAHGTSMILVTNPLKSLEHHKDMQIESALYLLRQSQVHLRRRWLITQVWMDWLPIYGSQGLQWPAQHGK